ncbi:hypothetical protein F5B19DRAFT_500672 [Rostrohypoxylon terebratum]|nr:hypothetical protein F5B19DRAFT_500672 [Rostrohypoxylon terebratum]
MASYPQLTFGVELEFVVTTYKEHMDDKRTLEAIAELFLRNLTTPLPCACINRKWSKYKGVANRYPDDVPLKKIEWKDYYCFSADSSVVPNSKEASQKDAQGKVATGLELSTRVLTFNEQGHSEFDTAVAATKLGGNPKDARISDAFEPSPTRSAGLHVHIGVESGLDLETSKKAAILGWLLEPCLFSLCDHHRGTSPSHGPIRKHSLLAQTKFDIAEPEGAEDRLEKTDVPGRQNTETTEHKKTDVSQENDAAKAEQPQDTQGAHGEESAPNDGDVPSSGNTSDSLPSEFSAQEKTWISAIFGAKNMDELADLLSSDNVNTMNRRLALTVYNREDDQSTIEFRHFQSTLDEQLAWKWVRVAAALVRAASKPVSEYREKLQLIGSEYQLMKSKWKQHVIDRTFQRETQDPWLDSWRWMLTVLDLEDDLTFWHDYVAQLPERNRQT